MGKRVVADRLVFLSWGEYWPVKLTGKKQGRYTMIREINGFQEGERVTFRDKWIGEGGQEGNGRRWGSGEIYAIWPKNGKLEVVILDDHGARAPFDVPDLGIDILHVAKENGA
jgi:hypothetical protein